MAVSVHVGVSFFVLTLAAACYVTSLVIGVWVESGGMMTFGIWKHCVKDYLKQSTWKCKVNLSDFNMAAQTFSILAIMCYICGLFLYIVYLSCQSLHKSRPITMGLCLLSFSVVTLQIMTMVVFGVKVTQQFEEVSEAHFSDSPAALRVSWSFTAAIVSTILATISGICMSIEMRNISIVDLE